MTRDPAYREASEKPELLPPVDLSHVLPAEEAFARALRAVDQVKPNKVIGNPPHPRWYAYLGFAQRAMAAARAVGWREP